LGLWEGRLSAYQNIMDLTDGGGVKASTSVRTLGFCCVQVMKWGGLMKDLREQIKKVQRAIEDKKSTLVFPNWDMELCKIKEEVDILEKMCDIELGKQAKERDRIHHEKYGRDSDY